VGHAIDTIISVTANTLDILFEDNHCLAVAKPAALLTQGPPGVPSLEALVKAYIRTKHQKPGNVYLGVPHRLDRPVSGVVLFARNSKAAQRLAEQFRERQVTKVYWGAVEGTVEPMEGVWEDWLRKLQDEARAERAEAHVEGAKPAVMGYRVLRHWDGASLLQYEPRTGRMHQIRVQSALRGHPLLGDELYGSSRSFSAAGVVLPRDRMIALHARSLTFLHPIRYEPITLTAAVPSLWRDLGIPVE
jgi:23S rRNA pseudouridine1911/1915/1917 synthase